MNLNNNHPKVALLGLILESNRFARPAQREDFLSLTCLRAKSLIDEANASNPSLAIEFASFVKTMNASGEWEPYPIILMASRPLGPIQKAVFDEYCSEALDALTDDIDAIYLCHHGAMVAEHLDDPDGYIAREIRKKVGPKVPIVMTLDLHANISDEMCSSVDLICGYRTNPHVDQFDRGQEAAFALRQIFAGQAKPKIAHIKLPLAPSSITLLTASGPLGQVIDFGQRRQAELGGKIMNVSIFGNFIFSDVPQNGVSIVVTARNDFNIARNLAAEIAKLTWIKRPHFVRELTSFDSAIKIVKDQNREPVIFSDSGDNPGGGGTGRTTQLLIELIKANAKGVMYGSFFDPKLAEEAKSLAVGSQFKAAFNRESNQQKWEEYDKPFTVDAEVIGLHDGEVVGRLGIFSGRKMSLGNCALLKIGDIKVVIISERCQTADPIFFEMFGQNIASAHTVIVKSRGHFRAGFEIWFDEKDVYEIDTVGLTSPVLERWTFQNVPPSSFPFDKNSTWSI
jgi:microcystin degradation protein MlrC